MNDNEYEFRRGYNYGFSDGNAEGKAWEQRRIIKLLEKRKALLEDPNNHYFSLTYIQQLIKGETNE